MRDIGIDNGSSAIHFWRIPRAPNPHGAGNKLPMNELGKLLVVGGLVMAAVGALLWSGFGRGWLGRLPGDVHYSRDNFSFHFPIVTCLLLSALVSFIFWILRKL